MQFYTLRTIGTDATSNACTEASEVSGALRGEAPSCATCGCGIGTLSWLPPFRVVLEARGTEFGDFATLGGDDILVSERFYNIYASHRLTGLSGLEPVEIRKVKRSKKTLGDPPRYLRGHVLHSRTAIDVIASEFEWDEPPSCNDCLSGIIRSWKRTVVDGATWTGEDIFIPRGLSAFIVSQRFKDVCDVNSVTNAVFVPAEESGYDFYAAGKISSREDQC